MCVNVLRACQGERFIVGTFGVASSKHDLEAHKLQPPQAWDALLDQAFKNQLVMTHPADSGTAYTALMTVLQLGGVISFISSKDRTIVGEVPIMALV